MDYTTTGLFANIRRRAMLPSASAAGTADTDLLAIANDELWLNVAADLLSVREEYFGTYTDTTLSGVEYRIPPRAIGQTLRTVSLRDSTGQEVALTRLRPEQTEQWSGSAIPPFGFRLRGGYLVLVPSATTSFTTLRMEFAARPSELTATATDYGAISTINASTGVLTFLGSGTFSGTVDFVCGKPGFDLMAADVAVVSSAANTVTVAASSLPTGLAVGDYVCVAGKSPVPTIPAEFHPILAIRTARTLCQNLGDYEAVKVLDDQLTEAEKDAGLTITSPRTQGSAEKLVARVNSLNGGRRRAFGMR